MKSCGMNLIKYILFIFNFIFAISGLAILIVGALVLADINEFSHFLESRVTAPPIVLIVTGLIIFFIASLGCFGAVKELPSLLILYAVLLLIIYIIELAVGIAAVVYRADLENALKTSLETSLKRSSPEDLRAWDSAQQKLMCCGVNAPFDWPDLTKNHTVRASCCRPEYINKTSNDCAHALPLFKDKYYQDGCALKLKERIESNAVIIMGVGIGIAFFQFIGIIFACMLAYSIRRERAK